MNSALYVLNFYSPVFVDQLRSGRKTATIRLGDKSRKYKRGQVVWITDIEHDNPEFRRREETVDFLATIYSRPISDDDTVTVIRFSQIVERPSTQFGNGETPSRN